MRWLDGIIDSMYIVWVNSGSWWWKGRPGGLWSTGSQRVGHDWQTELTDWLSLPGEASFSQNFNSSKWMLAYFKIWLFVIYPTRMVHRHLNFNISKIFSNLFYYDILHIHRKGKKATEKGNIFATHKTYQGLIIEKIYIKIFFKSSKCKQPNRKKKVKDIYFTKGKSSAHK